MVDHLIQLPLVRRVSVLADQMMAGGAACPTFSLHNIRVWNRNYRKSEARNPNFETNSNVQNLSSPVLDLVHLDLGFVSDFDIRISDL